MKAPVRTPENKGKKKRVCVSLCVWWGGNLRIRAKKRGGGGGVETSITWKLASFTILTSQSKHTLAAVAIWTARYAPALSGAYSQWLLYSLLEFFVVSLFPHFTNDTTETKKVKYPAQSHMTSKWQRQKLNSDLSHSKAF